jgi:hypothetical protein
MSKDNKTVVILTTLVVISLFSVAAGLIWIGYQLTQSKTGSINNATAKSGDSKSTANPDEQASASNNSQLDYTQLQQALQQKNWKGADRATYELMLQAAGPKALAKGIIPKDEMEKLPCNELKTIDNLWTKASNNQQGFSVQQDILRAQGDYRKMYAQVGWQSLSGDWLIDWNYNPQTKRMEYQPGKEPNFKNPPSGHFPTVERGYNFDVSLNGALQRCGI